MSNIIPARIQNRRGKRQDLPQPLLPGELGFCTDTRELFIGADPSDITGITAPIIHVFGEYVGVNNDYTQTPVYTETYLHVANTILNSHLVQVDLDGSDTYPVLNEDLTAITSTVAMIRVEQNGHQRAYIVYKSSQPTLPSYPTVTSGTVSFMGSVKEFTGRELNLSGLSSSGQAYTVLDTSAISRLINWVFDNSIAFQNSVGTGTGLVTMSQNIEIKTEAADTYDNEVSVLRRTLVNNATQSPTGIWLSVKDSNSYDIKYTVGNSKYIRKGSMSVIFVDGAFDIVDDYHEVTSEVTISENIVFDLNVVSGTNSGVLEITYLASGLPVGDETNFSVNITRWNSF